MLLQPKVAFSYPLIEFLHKHFFCQAIPHCSKFLQLFYFFLKYHIIQPEVLVIQKGKIRIDLYSTKQKYLFSKILIKDDILVLIKGAHGFKILEPTDILEIKQGPYVEGKDKKIIER